MLGLVVLTAKYLYLAVLAVAAVVWLTRPRPEKLPLAIVTVVAGVFGLLLIKLAGGLYVDPRPFVVEHVTPLVPHAPDNGFPSDHTALTLVVALSVALFSWRWGVLLVALALAVGAARIAVGIHHPVDVLASVVIAGVSVAAARLLTRRYAARRTVAA